MSAVTTFAQNFWTKSWLSKKGWQSTHMPYQLNTPTEPYTFEASSFAATCVVVTLLDVGTNPWLVDLGEIPSYAIIPSNDGRWEEVDTPVT
jgi:hypothetical protein